MDGVPRVTQPSVMPGDTFVYEFEARIPGSFLYHSHAGYQLDQGLYGPLIIEPTQIKEPYDRDIRSFWKTGLCATAAESPKPSAAHRWA